MNPVEMIATANGRKRLARAMVLPMRFDGREHELRLCDSCAYADKDCGSLSFPVDCWRPDRCLLVWEDKDEGVERGIREVHGAQVRHH